MPGHDLIACQDPCCVRAWAIVQIESSITVLDSSLLVEREMLGTKGIVSASRRALVPSASYIVSSLRLIYGGFQAFQPSTAWKLPRGEFPLLRSMSCMHCVLQRQRHSCVACIGGCNQGVWSNALMSYSLSMRLAHRTQWCLMPV